MLRHFVRQRPGGRRDEQGAVHRLTNLSQVDELPRRQRYHVCAFVRSTSPLAQSLVEIRSMLTRRDPNLGAMVFCVQCGGASDLAYIANGVLVRCRVPVQRLPCCGSEVAVGCAHEHRNMLRIQRMAMSPAILSPQVVVVDLHGRQCTHGCLGRKHLTIDRAVLGLRLGLITPGRNSAGMREQSCCPTIKVGLNCTKRACSSASLMPS